MKTIVATIIALAGAMLRCGAQPNTVFSSPCDQLDCQVAPYQYTFCDDQGRLRIKCSSDPNNEPGLTPVKMATPLHFCTPVPENPRYPAIFIRDTANPYDEPDTLFNIYETANLSALAEARWTLICPPQGPNADYQYCCVSVQWSNSPENFANSPGRVGGTRALTSQKPDLGGGCGIVCQESYIVLNQQDEFTRLNENGAPTNFFFTDPSGLGRLPHDYHYISFYSLILHELGHWLGMGGHADAPDRYQNLCPYPPGSIMVTGEHDNWDSRIVDLTSSDICMFKKLYCCDQTKNHALYGAGVGDESTHAPALSFEVAPNPGRDIIVVRFSGTIGARGGMLRIVDASGGVAMRQDIPGGATTSALDIAGLASGTYMLELITRTGTAARKVVVLH